MSKLKLNTVTGNKDRHCQCTYLLCDVYSVILSVQVLRFVVGTIVATCIMLVLLALYFTQVPKRYQAPRISSRPYKSRALFNITQRHIMARAMEKGNQRNITNRQQSHISDRSHGFKSSMKKPKHVVDGHVWNQMVKYYPIVSLIF